MVFGSSAITSDIVQRAVYTTMVRLHMLNCAVIAVVVDGPSENRGWQSLSAEISLADITVTSEAITSRVALRHPCTGEPVFLISDPSHWIKKARNALENS